MQKLSRRAFVYLLAPTLTLCILMVSLGLHFYTSIFSPFFPGFEMITPALLVFLGSPLVGTTLAIALERRRPASAMSGPGVRITDVIVSVVFSYIAVWVFTMVLRG